LNKTKEMAGDIMTEYDDESFIYAMALRQLLETKINNDITNGYIEIGDECIIFEVSCIIDEWLYMMIPADFFIMPTELAKLMYPNENRPDLIYTNEKGSINLTFTLGDGALNSRDLKLTLEYLQRLIADTNPSCKLISSDIIDMKPKVAYFDYISPAIDGDIYNLAFLFSRGDKHLLGSFNCNRTVMDDWSEIAKQMLLTIRKHTQLRE
jgi:hypothetical protein